MSDHCAVFIDDKQGEKQNPYYRVPNAYTHCMTPQKLNVRISLFNVCSVMLIFVYVLVKSDLPPEGIPLVKLELPVF